MRMRRWVRPFAAATTLGALAALTGLAVAPEGSAPARCNLDTGGPVKVRFLIPDGIAPGATVPIEGTITLREDAADLSLTAEARGPVEISVDPIDAGPRLAGDVVPFTARATYGAAGQASIAFTAQTRDWEGAPRHHDRLTLDALVRDDRSYAGVGGVLPLQLRALREDAERGLISTDELQAQRRALSQLTRDTEVAPPIATTPASPLAERLNVLVGAPPQGYAKLDGVTLMGDGNVTIQGNCTWQDQNGNTHPVYGANIQIWDDDTGPDEFVDVVATDANGNYSIVVNNDDGLLQGDRDIYVRFVTLNSWLDTFPDGGDTYSSDSGTYDETADGTIITENFNFTGNMADACSVFEASTWIMAYVVFDGNGSELSDLEVEWPSGEDGSFYNNEKLNIEQDDRWDWDTVHHELGHFVMDELDTEDNPGGDHSISGCHTDARGDDKSEGNRLAWAEGWPTYMGTSGQFEMNMASLNVPRVGDAQYDDLEDTSVSYSMESNDSTGRGEDNEAAVQRLLWDLYDNASDSRDSISRSDNSIWAAIEGGAGSPHILSHYWQVLQSGQSAGDLILMGEIASDHMIGPQLNAPAQGALVHPGNKNFSWQGLVGCPLSYTADEFNLKFFDASTFATLLTVSGLGSANHALSDANITAVASQSHNVLWGVEGIHTPDPETGPYLGETFAITINTPPVADAGSDIVAECTSPTTTPVGLNGTGSSDPDGDALTYAWGAPGVTFDNPLSATATGDFPIGVTVASLTVSDSIQQDEDDVNVTVQDTTDPVIDCPDNIIIECSAFGGAPATDPQLDPFFNGVSATDVCDADVSITSNAPPFFPLGVTNVTFTAEDNFNNTADCVATVTVQDTTPPAIDVSLDPGGLWPPNHTLRAITATLKVVDVCDPNPVVTLVSITSNEPDDGLGDGDTANDIQDAEFGTDDREFTLRAERSGKGTGRRYTITYDATDQSDNSAEDDSVVIVPHRNLLQFNSLRRDRGPRTGLGTRPGSAGGGRAGVGTTPATGASHQGTGTAAPSRNDKKSAAKGKKPAKQ